MPTGAAQRGRTEVVSSATLSFVVPVLVIVAGVYLRLLLSAETYLNPDEAYHFFLANRASLSLAYHASLGSAHPPLLIVLLYYLRQLSDSVIVLRLPSVIAGGLFCWAVFRWLGLIGGRSVALIGLILAALSPSLVSLGAEIRQYSLLLLFMACSLYFLERGIQRASWPLLLCSAMFEALAVLTHYSALMFIVVVGLYGFSRILKPRGDALLLASWIAGQAAVMGTVAALYLTQIRRLTGSGAPQAIAATYLESALYASGKTNVLTFGARATFRLFHYLFGQPLVAACLLLLFVLGLIFVCRGLAAIGNPTARRLFALLISAPLLNYFVALTRVYPYGGTRHCIWLSLFVIAGAAFGLAGLRLPRGTKTVVAAFLMTFCYLVPHPLGAFIRPSNQRTALMKAAVHYIDSTVPPGSVFLLDNQSNFAFRYYFCRDTVIDFNIPAPDFVDFHCGAYGVTAPTADSWMFTPASLPGAVKHAAQSFKLSPDDAVWFFQSGWAVEAEPALRARMRNLGCTGPREFGANIVICKLRAGNAD